MSRKAKAVPAGRHLIADNRQRIGDAWIECDTCPEHVTADGPYELVEAWYAHRLAFGFRSTGKAPTGEPSPFGKFHLTGRTPVEHWKRLAL